MTGKLIKYEFRSAVRTVGILWAALIASAVFLGIMMKSTQHFDFELQGLLEILDVVPVLLYVAIFVAMIVMAVIIIVLRFYKGLLGDEGYLMHTLPVKPWQLITAKGSVAGVIALISIVAAIISICTIAAFNDAGDFFGNMGEFFKELGKQPKYILYIIEAIIIILASLLKSVYQIYAALSIGQMAGKHRLLAALGAYVGISVILMILTILSMNIILESGIGEWLVDTLVEISVVSDGSMNRMVNNNGFAVGQAAVAVTFIITAVQIAVFHIISERIMTKKLNLI